jgi:hypothetical protein
MCLLYSDRVVVLNHIAGLPWQPLSAFSAVNRNADAPLTEHDFASRVRFDPFRSLSKQKTLLGYFRDVARRKVYAYSNTQIWNIDVANEREGQWRHFMGVAADADEPNELRQRCYQAAYVLTKQRARNRRAHGIVTMLYGKYYVEVGQLQRAALMLAECNRFEEVTLYLLELKRPVVMIESLQQRLTLLLQTHEDAAAQGGGSYESQLVCLATYILYLQLNRWAEAEMDGSLTAAQAAECGRSLTAFLAQRTSPSDMRHLIEDVGPYRVVEKLLVANGRLDVMMEFAKGMRHYQYAIRQYMKAAKYDLAVKVLTEKCVGDEFELLWYEFSPVHIQKCPVKLVSRGLFKCFGKSAAGRLRIQPERMMPAFVSYRRAMNEVPHEEDHQVIEFLDALIHRNGCESPVIWNYVVALMLREKDDRLVALLEHESPQYTTEFALRKCMDAGTELGQDMCIVLYRKLGLIEEAVRVALARGQIDLAKELVNECVALPGSVDLPDASRKQMWMEIVAEVMRHTRSITAVLDTIQESRSIVKLEDVLHSLTTDNSVVSEIKDAICDSLDEYAATIRTLKQDMNDATETAKRIKEEERALSHQFGYVAATQRCDLCGNPLLRVSTAMPFVVYPSCRHAFHERCVAKLLAACPRERREEMAAQLGVESADDVEALKNADCPTCGELAITGVEEPFYTPMRYPEDDSWYVQDLTVA